MEAMSSLTKLKSSARYHSCWRQTPIHKLPALFVSMLLWLLVLLEEHECSCCWPAMHLTSGSKMVIEPLGKCLFDCVIGMFGFFQYLAAIWCTVACQLHLSVHVFLGCMSMHRLLGPCNIACLPPSCTMPMQCGSALSNINASLTYSYAWVSASEGFQPSKCCVL